MNDPTLEERAIRGRRLLGLCLSAVLGILIFVPIFDYVVMRKIGLNQIAAGFGILLVVGAMRGDNVARIVLGILLAVLGTGSGTAGAGGDQTCPAVPPRLHRLWPPLTSRRDLV